MMYEAYWGLQRKPFENTSNADFYYPGNSHQAALLKLRYAIENCRQAAVLVGAPGLGKSLVVQSLFRSLPERFQPRVHLVFPQLPAAELLACIACELNGVDPGRDVPCRQESVAKIQRCLQQNVLAGRHSVVVVDEAHLLGDGSTLDTLRLLLNFETNSQASMTLLLVGQPSLLPLLDRQKDMEDRLAVKCLLRPFDQDESIAYVNHRLRHAGAQRAIFSEAALETLHWVTHGNPRQINRIGDLALLIGFAEESELVGSDAIEAVSRELMTVAAE
jgi:type II secretory pathway predicted ATPase ExeA